jgi:hypothetical protein
MLHVYGRRWLFVILAGILALSLLPGCAAEESGPTLIPEMPAKMATVPVLEVSLEEAEEMFGIPIAPKYLPAGYEFRRSFSMEVGSPLASVNLFFSDEEITGEAETTTDVILLPHIKIILDVNELSETPPDDMPQRMVKQAKGWGSTVIDASEVKGYLPPNRVSVVDINGVEAYLSTGETGYELQWNRSAFQFLLLIPRELTVEELIKIAESIG